MNNYYSKSLKLFCGRCDKNTEFVILGQSVDWNDKEMKWIIMCNSCGTQTFIEGKKLKELIKQN